MILKNHTYRETKKRDAVVVSVLFGPPQKKKEDAHMLKLFFETEGRHIVCGGTTAQLAAEYLGKELQVSLNYEDCGIPPVGSIEGVDLVTEGIVTLNRVLEYAIDFLSDNLKEEQWRSGTDGASSAARLLFEEAEIIFFFVGKAANPAHQESAIGFERKMKLVEDLADNLKIMGKQIHVNYF